MPEATWVDVLQAAAPLVSVVASAVVAIWGFLHSARRAREQQEHERKLLSEAREEERKAAIAASVGQSRASVYVDVLAFMLTAKQAVRGDVRGAGDVEGLTLPTLNELNDHLAWLAAFGSKEALDRFETWRAALVHARTLEPDSEKHVEAVSQVANAREAFRDQVRAELQPT